MTDQPFGRVYLDSNVIIAMFASDREADESRQLLDMVGAVRPSVRQPFVTSELTLSECLVRALRNGNLDDVRTFENMIVSSGWLEVGPVDRQNLLWTAMARSQYAHLKTPDAIHVATAIRLGCDAFLTADKGIREAYALNSPPWTSGFASAPVRVIRPTGEQLQSLIGWLEAR